MKVYRRTKKDKGIKPYKAIKAASKHTKNRKAKEKAKSYYKAAGKKLKRISGSGTGLEK